MGHPFAEVTVHGRDLSTSRELQLLVGTGSTYTWVGKDILRELKIEPLRRRGFRTVEGRRQKRQIGEALIRVDGERATTRFSLRRKTRT